MNVRDAVAVRRSLAIWLERESRYRRNWRSKRKADPRRAYWLGELKYAKKMVARRTAQLAAIPLPLRNRALEEAEKLIGVMESGGNNRGTKVTEIIRANGGTGPEPWCGDFVAYCYRRAGSKAVSRGWASVYFLGRLTGVDKVTDPKPGDLVRFTFSHVGLYVRSVSPGVIETIEGNTGASGAVSDSASGGDGVYRKRRSTALVLDYRRVTR